ncbi:MAG: Fic family protein [Planctomycetes bacterium]|nr:Fic family protein [Planctomycetota bacterium]
MTFAPRFTITHAITAALTKVERARGFLDAARLSEEWLPGMREEAFLIQAHHTTHIEGTQLTLEQSEQVLSGGRVPDASPDDVRELLNYRDAFELVASYLGSGEPITEGLIREIHKRLVSGVRGGSAGPGEYRRVQNYVAQASTGRVVYTPPPPGDVPSLMAELVAWLGRASEIHPVLVAGIAQFQLVDIHPFVDGNGRTSRLLSTLCLYRTGYDFKRLFTISGYYDRDRTAFYVALQGVRERGQDLTSWLEYFTEGLSTQMREVQDRGETLILRDVLSQKHGLSTPQRVILGRLLQHPGINLEEVQELLPETPRRSLQRELKSLLEKGVITSEGATNRVVYRLAPGLR